MSSCLPDRFLLDVEPELREKLYQHLDKFIIADDVTLAGRPSAELSALCFEGPTAAEALASLKAPIPESPYSHVDWNGWIVARVSSTGAPGFRIFGPGEALARFVVRGRGIRPHRAPGARQTPLWRGHLRYHSAAGNPAEPRAALQQRMLYRTGDRGADPLPWAH